MCVQPLHVSKQWYGYQGLECLTCAEILMHVTAHRGCTNTLKVGTDRWQGKKSHATSGSRTCISIVLDFSVRCPSNWATSHPKHPNMKLNTSKKAVTPSTKSMLILYMMHQHLQPATGRTCNWCCYRHHVRWKGWQPLVVIKSFLQFHGMVQKVKSLPTFQSYHLVF